MFVIKGYVIATTLHPLSTAVWYSWDPGGGTGHGLIGKQVIRCNLCGPRGGAAMAGRGRGQAGKLSEFVNLSYARDYHGTDCNGIIEAFRTKRHM